MPTLLIAPSFLSIYAAAILSLAWLITPGPASGPEPATAYASAAAYGTMTDAAVVAFPSGKEPAAERLPSREMEREDEMLLF